MLTERHLCLMKVGVASSLIDSPTASFVLRVWVGGTLSSDRVDVVILVR